MTYNYKENKMHTKVFNHNPYVDIYCPQGNAKALGGNDCHIHNEVF